MIELRDQDLVTFLQRAPDGRAQGKIERGHVLTEGNAFRSGGAEEGGKSFARDLHAPVDFAGGGKIAVGVHVACPVEIRHCLNHGGGHLDAAGTIQENEVSLQRREIAAATFAVIGRERHYSRS